MNYKAISGVIKTKPGKGAHGEARIDLNTGTIHSNWDGTFKKKTMFGSGRFKTEPCYTISLRYLKSKDSDKGDFSDHTHWDKANLDHNFLKSGDDFNVLQVHWNARPWTTSEIEEISVLVIGETE